MGLDESRLEEIEQRVRDASERGGRNWYKTDVPELLRAVRVERERAERLEQALQKVEPLIDAQFEGHADTAEFMEKTRKLNEALDVVRAVLAEQEKQGQ